MAFENTLLYVHRIAFSLFIESLNSNFVIISVPSISLRYLYPFILCTLESNISIKSWNMLKAVLQNWTKQKNDNENTHNTNLKPRYPFSPVGASKLFRIHKFSSFLSPYIDCLETSSSVLFFFREERVAFEELCPKDSGVTTILTEQSIFTKANFSLSWIIHKQTNP